MSLADKIAARLQPKIDAVVEQARYEIENVNHRPDRAQRETDNHAHDEAERRNATGR